MKLTENTKVRIKVPKHMYEAIQAELAKKPEMEESYEEHMEEENINEYYGVDPKLDILTLALGAGVPIVTAAAALVQQIGFKGALDLVKKSIAPKDKKAEIEKAIVAAEKGEQTPEAPVAEEEVEEALDLESLMEAVKDIAKKKAEDKKKKMTETKDKEKVERFEVIIHKNGKKVSGKDYPNREAADSAFEKASKDLENDVYLNDNIGRHLKTRKGKKKAEAANK